MTSAIAAQEVIFELDPAQTDVRFTVSDVLHTLHGAFKLKSGAITFNSVTAQASGAVTVDVTSGASGSGARDRRMQKDILQSEKYPEAVFTPDHVDGHLAPQGVAELQVHGLFKLHGTDHEMTLPMHVEISNGQLVATTHFSIPYVKWGMKNPSTLLLRVSDQVQIDIRATGHLRAPVEPVVAQDP